MHINEALKQELTQWIETYWATYLTGDLETWATFLRDDYRNIGGTKEEIWNNKQEILEYTSRKMDQIKGNVEFRNREIDIIPYGSQVMLHEFTDVYIKVEGEWILYGPFRMTSLLERTDDGWIAVHQHGSYPDMKAMEGEAFSINTLKAENARLIEAVKIRTNELEIEDSLERVRSAALGMKKPDDMLDVCRVIAAQLQQFGVDNIRNVQTAIIDKNIGQYLCYQYYPAYEQSAIEDTQYQKSQVENEMVRQMLVSRNGHFIGSLTGKELDTFRAHRKEVNQFLDPLLDHASVVSYSFLSIGEGGLGLSLYRDMEEKVLTLFKRFHQVFNLAYQRFRDIQIAEAQAREAQVEAALERVRAASMAMMDSKALSGIIYKLYAELTKLDAKLDRAFIMIVHPESLGITWWLAGKEGLLAENGFFIQKNQHPSHLMYLDCWQNRKKKWQYLFDGKEKKDWDRFGFSETELSRLPDFIKEDMAGVKRVYLSGSSDQFGSIVTGSFEPLPEEQQEIISRFTVVFNQTYTRFLDLQKAEAQAREAKIEAALEKVRARAMAMHSSEELNEVVQELRKQMGILGQKNLETCVIHLHDELPDFIQSWAAIKPPDEEGEILQSIANVPKKGLMIIEEALDAYNRMQEDYVIINEGEKLKEWFAFLKKESPEGFTKLAESVNGNIQELIAYWSFADFSGGSLLMVSRDEPDQPTRSLLRRFSNVFGLAYRRFADLKHAEAQAREAQIEAALERVRSRSMGMQKSDELKEVIQIVYDQLFQLKLPVEHSGFILDYKNRNDYKSWIADHLGSPSHITLPYFKAIYYDRFNDAKQRGESFFAVNLTLKEKNKFYRDLFKHLPGFPKESKAFILRQPALTISTVLLDDVALYIENFSGTPFSEEENAVLMRFGKVFQQTYSRFLDLQKAEAQAREAQIEVSLERVRAKTMAMHSSEDVSAATATMFTELEKLGIENIRGGITIISPDQMQEVWSVTNLTEGNIIRSIGIFDMRLHPFWRALYKSWNNKEQFQHYWLAGKEKEEYIKILNETPKYLSQPIEEIPDVHIQSYFFGDGAVWANSIKPHSDTDKLIMQRFASVFSLTFRRYQDLRKAESQAREAQIEAALERVRSKTMAMHNSNDVGESVATLFDELTALGVLTAQDRCGIGIMHPDEIMEAWTAAKSPEGKAELTIGHINMKGHRLLESAYKGWMNKSATNQYILEGEDKLKYYDTIKSQSEYKIKRDYYSEQVKIVHTDFYFNEGCLYVFSKDAFSTQSIAVFMRFAGVFAQTYRRYLDLRYAEAQAWEATIQASLERVRAKAMAMHTSKDLMSTAGIVFTELRNLKINSFRGGIGLIDKESRFAKMYSATSSEEVDTLSLNGTIVLDGHPVLSKIWECMMSQTDYLPILKGELLESYISRVTSAFNSPLIKSPYDEWYGCFLFFPEGAFYVWSDKAFTEDEIKVLKRFRGIVDLTFRRYLELQQAEANALEALRSASLDRVRAEIASMRTKQDLDRITPLIWRELTILGITFIRCGVFIMDEKTEEIQTYLSTPDGKSLSTFRLGYDATGQSRQIVSHWHDKTVFNDHMDEAAFIAYTKDLVRLGAVGSSEKYVNENLPKDLYLHFLPFLQGMLYVGNVAPLSHDALELVQHLADAFSTAYARYEDFSKLEEAKAIVEAAMNEIKNTQNQLVQQEKLASLGQLTAGIAHEIKNPLNFVNNFSEVSLEMLEEIDEERAKNPESRDEGLIDEILSDIRSNLKKVHEHGTRANGIVNSMLQHSRGGTGKKEETDLNVLIKEYVNLSFHGMRAGKNPINVDIALNLDEKIGWVHLIKEDFTRVIINLCNNAFDAMRSKTLTDQSRNYLPKLTVTSKKEGKTIKISVRDNGPGIPDDIKEKILQPFFTTKKGTEGTGLGLSITNDIIKAHGGGLNIESHVGEGTSFIIQIPTL